MMASIHGGCHQPSLGEDVPHLMALLDGRRTPDETLEHLYSRGERNWFGVQYRLAAAKQRLRSLVKRPRWAK